tara:strand:+ start:326 stop:703 length:378 start_codon:yes stop_codon:yes gene_type:complete
MPSYENLNNDDPSPLPNPSQVERRNRCAYCLLVSMLVSMILTLIMLIVFYVTFVEVIEEVKNSPFLNTISHINLKPIDEAFKEITSDEVKQFVTDCISLLKQVTVDDVSEFFKGAEQCLEGVCSA